MAAVWGERYTSQGEHLSEPPAVGSTAAVYFIIAADDSPNHQTTTTTRTICSACAPLLLRFELQFGATATTLLRDTPIPSGSRVLPPAARECLSTRSPDEVRTPAVLVVETCLVWRRNERKRVHVFFFFGVVSSQGMLNDAPWKSCLQ